MTHLQTFNKRATVITKSFYLVTKIFVFFKYNKLEVIKNRLTKN